MPETIKSLKIENRKPRERFQIFSRSYGQETRQVAACQQR